jgi:hypothetical protein
VVTQFLMCGSGPAAADSAHPDAGSSESYWELSFKLKRYIFSSN